MKKSKSVVGIAVGVSSIVLVAAGLIAHRSVRLRTAPADSQTHM